MRALVRRPARAAAVLLSSALLLGPSREASAQASTGASQSAIVYGDDDRRDYFELSDARWQRRIERSVVEMMSAGQLDDRDRTNQQPVGPTLREGYYVCATERFANQITAGECSATLVDEQLVLTAGHCVEGGRWRGMKLVFGFYYEREGELSNIDENDVYVATRLVASEWSRQADYGFIELDRPVVGHAPAPVRVAAPEAGERAIVIGFPSTLPCKFDDGGTINYVGPGYLNADTDTFGGNSGSGVWDEQGRLIGILSAGGEDYVPSPRGGCYVANRVPPCTRAGCGESIARVDVAVQALCASGYASARLCGSLSCGDGTCDALERGSCELDCGDARVDPPDAGPASDAGVREGGLAGDGGLGAGAPRPGCGCAVVGARRERENTAGSLRWIALGALALSVLSSARRARSARAKAKRAPR